MSQKNDLEKLKKCQERFENSKASVNRFQGELDGLLKSLKEKHDITSLKQIERKLKQMKKQREGLAEEFSELLSEIEEMMDNE